MKSDSTSRDVYTPIAVARFQVHAAAAKGVAVTVPRFASRFTVGLSSVMVVFFVVMIVLSFTTFHLNVFGVVAFVCVSLLGIGVLGWMILGEIYGFQHISISDTTFTIHDHLPCCAKRPKFYAFERMGPMRVDTATYTTSSPNGSTVQRSQRVVAFPYGDGGVVRFGSHFKEDELESFLEAITPFLPDHVKPRRNDLGSTEPGRAQPAKRS
ncbi:Aste57867_856 [Aphanomyces stellatus]|uniref:Aste57867_856 protein n=1 Tax=Aphanomyces stellatus TaxID=120398 RepID=A0A485K4X9_9STRA|nr:hypothetical protein As57867_000855 [Aphanomyces stellatus]VFT78080.1 Aste57867_856 [Aphanomyces stellatus]